MGAVLGKIGAETPKYAVIHQGDSFEVREYEPAMAAAVTYPGDIYRSDDMSDTFRVLARYIGVFTSPQNVKAEAIAMTAPVVMHPPSASSSSSSSSTNPSDGGSLSGKAEGERIAMTSPVVLQPAGSDGHSSYGGEEEEGKQLGEKIAMTAPVVLQSTPDQVVGTTGDGGEAGENKGDSSPAASPSPSSAQSPPPAGLSSMMFILPTKYTRLDMVPKPTDPRVVIVELPRRKMAVVRFSGTARKEVAEEKEQQLLQAVVKDGFKVVGKPSLMLYNPPFTLPMFRTNEVSVAVE